MFKLPEYQHPDFNLQKFVSAPDVRIAPAEQNGVVPDNYHATSLFPEYFKINGKWILAEESRMDCAVLLREDGRLDVIEMRNVKIGEKVILGRSENGEDGIYIHTGGFIEDKNREDNFAFRSNRSRETAYSQDYDHLYELLKYERENGNIVWVMGPAFAFDADARHAMQKMAEAGYVNALLSGNALATHDLEAGLFRTGLGQDIYTQKTHPNGHYHHLDVLNFVRRSGSIQEFIASHDIQDGIMFALVKQNIPFVLTGSIRDDGPLPEIIGDVYSGQEQMRNLLRKATTLICLATQLHTIAAGNLTPSFRVVNGVIRPLYIYSVDISEFVVNKLFDRGSLSSISIVTNAQDFIVHVAKGVGVL
ncbi:MAG: hypothetical protein FWH38_05080 [Treponema sp.]|nr:hypothetical protein [Treponema sp.]